MHAFLYPCLFLSCYVLVDNHATNRIYNFVFLYNFWMRCSCWLNMWTTTSLEMIKQETVQYILSKLAAVALSKPTFCVIILSFWPFKVIAHTIWAQWNHFCPPVCTLCYCGKRPDRLTTCLSRVYFILLVSLNNNKKKYYNFSNSWDALQTSMCLNKQRTICSNIQILQPHVGLLSQHYTANITIFHSGIDRRPSFHSYQTS